MTMPVSKHSAKPSPPDQPQRERALDPTRSVLVRAPAGSGKTTLLTERFLCLLAEVDEPGQVVAITFTEAAAAEMRNRILDQLEADEPSQIARTTLQHSRALGWNLLDLPAQLRISTIDSFCRQLALQQPLLSGLGGGLEIAPQPAELYRRAARRTLEQIGKNNAVLSAAIETMLLWRDNNWTEVEGLLVNMLGDRDRWMHDFLLDPTPDWDALRTQLERPFARGNLGGAASDRYMDDEWQIVRACFILLRRAAAELRVVFAESGTVDFTEVAQIALNVLKGEDGLPTDAAFAVADGIRHLLVDEFQDTSRRQHQLLAHLIAAWPEREGRTCFVVGDPMQSIYFFRDADAELFPRVEQFGLETHEDKPLRLDLVELQANFRSASALVDQLNEMFTDVFAVGDGSGISYAAAAPQREHSSPPGPHLAGDEGPPMRLHVRFIPQAMRTNSRGYHPDRKLRIAQQRAGIVREQIEELVDLIRSHQPKIDAARSENERSSANEEKIKYRIAVLGRTRAVLARVAHALRAAGIPFRAVELESLQDRPEIVDALALGRALLNTQDRVAWLGVLRAPWCGLSLADLHILASADDKDLKLRPVPDLLTERASLLSEEGRIAAARVGDALAYAERLRSLRPASTLGTWLEQVWLHLGGVQCVDATARANLDLLWRTIDGLEQGEAGFLGSALDAALQDLKASPDPDAESDYGVQLMTIHGAKGLEFEFVIIPDLQASERNARGNMLSWLERGLPEPDDSGEPTEFLVAPIQPKGDRRGTAKEWVDGVRREREKQELRRLLYVAATRAREELHLFAHLDYKTADDGAFSLAEPSNSLLKTAWPALRNEIQHRFEQWQTEASPQTEESHTIDSLAASAENVLLMPAPSDASAPTPAQLRRLPQSFRPASAEFPSAADVPLTGTGRLYERHEGGLRSRALGKAVHELFERFAEFRVTETNEIVQASLARLKPRIIANLRASGIPAAEAERIAARAFEIVSDAAGDPQAQWILAPHADAANEALWTGVIAGSLRNVRVDRVFRAGQTPQSSDENSTWWIVDYKTAHETGLDPQAALPKLRREFAPQIEAYAKVLRNLHGADSSVRGGLYYPRMKLLDWWEL
jgi:ATP-dependent exoDNAse (exonuclease V) beta subunit